MSGAPPNVAWDGVPVWGPGVTPNPDGTATLVITDAEQSPTIVVTNTLTELFGTFGVAKQVDGDFDLDSPEMADAAFTVTASWAAAPGLEAGSVELVLNADKTSQRRPGWTCRPARRSRCPRRSRPAPARASSGATSPGPVRV